jgi:glycosyltransferase involved in cell wall biosynthesis
MSYLKYEENMKIAILHEMLIKLGGAEKVVESILKIYPKADLYTLIYDERKIWKVFPKSKIHPSCAKTASQKIYNITKKQRLCLPFMARSVESLDFSSYDRVIVSSSWFAHWLKTWKGTKTIVYYHAPARYMWDWTHEYCRDIWCDQWIKWFLFGHLLLKLRMWDYEASGNNDILFSNSVTTQSRVQKYFRRDSHVLYPPIETKRFAKNINSPLNPLPFQGKGATNYYIILSALTEFKKIDVAIKAFKNISEVHLLIIWAGEYKNKLEQLAKDSKNIQFSWARYWDDLVSLVQNSLWLIFPGEEDFGIVPIEVMAAWKPVFALHKWGLTESVIAWVTWEFFKDAEWWDFIEKFQKFHKNNTKNKYTPGECKKQASKFDEAVFHKKIRKYVQ